VAPLGAGVGAQQLVRECRELSSCLAVCLLALVAPLISSAAPGQTIVQILPDEGRYATQEEIELQVWISNVVDLYAADIQLTFDAAKLTVIDASPSIPGVQITLLDDLLSPDFVVHREADNKGGTVWYAATQLNPREPASGSGPVFSLKLRTHEPGVSMVTVQQELVTRHAEPIPSDAQGVKLSVEGVYSGFLPMVTVSH